MVLGKFSYLQWFMNLERNIKGSSFLSSGFPQLAFHHFYKLYFCSFTIAINNVFDNFLSVSRSLSHGLLRCMRTRINYVLGDEMPGA